jgi:hypothetical protein
MAVFISAVIEALFHREPAIKKRAGPPDAFVWDGRRFEVVEVLSEWHDYDKRREIGETRRSQSQLYRQRGSWGLGRDWYRVQTGEGRLFDLYYERRPRSRTVIGSWVLYCELDETDLLLD